VASIDSPDVQALLADPAAALIGYPNAEAYIEISPVLHHVVLPSGARSLAKDEPAQPIDLLAPKAGVAIRQDLNGSVKYLLLRAMRQVHGPPRMFTKSNEFPAPETIGLRLSDLARSSTPASSG
jgi:CDP-diacylglycerol pyrophosphatase